MRFTINRAAFLSALKLAAGIAPRKSPVAILSSVLLRVESPTKLTIAATDAQGLSIVTTAPIVSGEKGGGSCIEAKGLLDIVTGVKTGDEVTIRTIENTRVEVKCGRSKYEIVAVPDRDFPKVPASPDASAWVDVDALHLADVLARVAPAVSLDENRVPFNGALMQNRKTCITAVGTDGHRMAVADTSLPLAMLSKDVVIPMRGLVEMQRALAGASACWVSVVGTDMFLRVAETVLAVKLISADYPAWHMMMPGAKDKWVSVNRAELADAIKNVAMMSTETIGATMAFVKGSAIVTVTAVHHDKGTAQVELTLPEPWSRADFTVEAHPPYLIDSLNACDSEMVDLRLAAALDPIGFRSADGNTTAVVMPMARGR